MYKKQGTCTWKVGVVGTNVQYSRGVKGVEGEGEVWGRAKQSCKQLQGLRSVRMKEWTG